MITGSQHDELMSAQRALLAVLRAAAQHRDERPDVEDRDGERAPGWVFFERERMLTAVNFMRLHRDLDPVTLDDVRRAEQLAEGHSDYASKYSLHCAELVLGIDPRF